MYGTVDFLRQVTSTPDEVRKNIIVKDAITKRLGDNIKTIVQSHTKRDEPLPSTEITNNLVVDMETVFLHGLKQTWLNQKLYHKDPYEMPQLSFWHFLMVYSHKSMISQINGFNQITTDVGRCRAWIRLALNEGILSSYLSTIVKDHKQLKKSYQHFAYLRDTERMDILLKILAGLECFCFDLATNSRLLNEWIDTPIMMSGAWTPPVISERGLDPVECAVEVLEDSSEEDEKNDSLEASSSSHEPVLYSATSTTVSQRVVGLKNKSGDLSTTDTMVSKSHPARSESPLMATRFSTIPKPMSRQQQEMTRELLEDAVFAACFSANNSRVTEILNTDTKSIISVSSDIDSTSVVSGNSKLNDVSKTISKSNNSTTTNTGSIETGNFSTDYGKIAEASKPNLESDNSILSNTTPINPTSECTSTIALEKKELSVMKDEPIIPDTDKTEKGYSPVPEEAAVNENEPTSLIGRNRGWSFSQDDPDQGVASTSAPIEIGGGVSSSDESYATVLRKYESTGLSIMGTPEFSFMSQIDKLKDTTEETPVAKTYAEVDGEDSKEYDIVGDTKTEYPMYFSLKQHIQSIPRDLGLASQNFTCKGCPGSIGVMYENQRFCMYSGSYFCDRCFGDQMSEIPSRMVYNWDFKKYPVSAEAKKFLEESIEDPVFNLMELNPKIVEVLPELFRIKDARTRLHYLRGYLLNCRDSTANELRKLIYPSEYLYEHINLYALKDFLSVRNGELLSRLLAIEKFARSHVLACQLCKGKGYICELCSKEPVIYPFDTKSTYRCPDCSAVYHFKCWKNNPCCSKCIRLVRRRKKRVAQQLDSDAEMSHKT